MISTCLIPQKYRESIKAIMKIHLNSSITMHVNSIISNSRRKIFFGYFCILLFGFGMNSCTNSQKKEEAVSVRMIRETSAYLWSQQQEDGGWHSTKHGILKGGQAYTPFVLMYLMEVPDSIFQKDHQKIASALDFIRNHCNTDGVLGLSDPDILEYPNYATSFALRVLLRHGKDQDSALVQRMQKYLLKQQFDEDRDIHTDHAAYGSWGFGELNLSGGFVGHADLSHTRRILQALKESGLESDSVYHKAKVFLELIQGERDGGFYYSPVVTGANKGGLTEESTTENYDYQSYATATADGLLAAIAAGYTQNDELLKKAIHWLKLYNRLDQPPGIPENNPGQWHRVMILYHLAVRAEAYKQINFPGEWAREMLDVLKEKQQPDGSFANPEGARNKENDPILGSTLALKTLICTLGRN